MKNSGKFKTTKNKEREEKIKKLENELNEKIEEGVETKHNIKVITPKGKEMYLVRNDNGTLTLKKEEKPLFANSEKAKTNLNEYINNLKKQGYTIEHKEEEIKKIKNKYQGFERTKREDEIKALKNGYDSYQEYTEAKKIQKEKTISNFKKDFENSYVGKNAKKGLEPYNSFYDDEDRTSNFYNPEVFSELIKRVAKKEMNIEEVHSSAKSGSKFANSIYLKDKDSGIEVRISNHDLPQTAEREYNRSRFGTRWDNEIVLNKETMNEIVQIKTEEDFKKYINKLFKR